jgi:hypothetical protein
MDILPASSELSLWVISAILAELSVLVVTRLIKLLQGEIEMVNQLDLHMHSNISNDGEYTPSQLMGLCNEHGLKMVALADHNSIGGLAEA